MIRPAGSSGQEIEQMDRETACLTESAANAVSSAAKPTEPVAQVGKRADGWLIPHPIAYPRGYVA
jgi:hypothetical protein